MKDLRCHSRYKVAMVNHVTKEDILKYRETKRKEWISLKVREMVNYVNKYTKYNEDEYDYTSVNTKVWIPRKYLNTRDEIYAELKACYPDCMVIVTIEKKNMLLWCLPRYELFMKVSWN